MSKSPVRVNVWRDSERLIDVVRTRGNVTRVVRGERYRHAHSVACELTDTGNGFIARFPARDCTEQDAYACLDYAQARDLVLALTPHRKELGFTEP